MSNLGPMREITHVSSFLVLPNHLHYEWLLLVEAVMVFGSGVAGLSVLTHTHTPPRLTSLWQGKTTAITHAGDSTLPTTLLLLTHFHFRVLSIGCSSSHRELLFILTHWTSWFYPRRPLFFGFADGVAVSTHAGGFRISAVFLTCDCCGLLYAGF